MSKITIIQLLNKIANGEEVPTIEYNGSRCICYYLYDRCGEQWDDKELKNILNYEVEIIEEDKKLPEKLTTWFSLEKDSRENNRQYANHNFETMYDKINEIIDYLESKEKGE